MRQLPMTDAVRCYKAILERWDPEDSVTNPPYAPVEHLIKRPLDDEGAS